MEALKTHGNELQLHDMTCLLLLDLSGIVSKSGLKGIT